MEEEQQRKWEGKSSIELLGLSADQIWPLLEDFCSLHNWFPIDISYQLDGVYGQPGLIRYCASTSGGTDDRDHTVTKWCHEKLLMIDPIQRRLSYEVLDNNVGFKSYVATVEIMEINGEESSSSGCKIEWSFVSNPVEGWRFEDLVNYVDYCLHYMAGKMEDHHHALISKING